MHGVGCPFGQLEGHRPVVEHHVHDVRHAAGDRSHAVPHVRRQQGRFRRQASVEVAEQLTHPVIAGVGLDETPRPARSEGVERPPQAGEGPVAGRDRLPHIGVEQPAALRDPRESAVAGIPPVDDVGGDAGDGEQVEPVRRVAHCSGARGPRHRDSIVAEPHADGGADHPGFRVDRLALPAAENVLEAEDRAEVLIVEETERVRLVGVVVELAGEHVLPALGTSGVRPLQLVAIQRELVGHLSPPPSRSHHSTGPRLDLRVRK